MLDVTRIGVSGSGLTCFRGSLMAVVSRLACNMRNIAITTTAAIHLALDLPAAWICPSLCWLLSNTSLIILCVPAYGLQPACIHLTTMIKRCRFAHPLCAEVSCLPCTLVTHRMCCLVRKIKANNDRLASFQHFEVGSRLGGAYGLGHNECSC